MKCEELEAIVFSGKEPTEEQRMQMQEHAKSCEACRALLNSAELLGGMREIDDDVELPESFTAGWRQAVRAQSRQPIRSDIPTWRARRRSICPSRCPTPAPPPRTPHSSECA